MSPSTLLIRCWESAIRSPAAWRPLALLVAAAGGVEADSLACEPLGSRETRLLGLRRRLFGERVEAIARCPSCGTAVDLVFQARDLLVERPDDAPLSATYDAWSVTFRLPDSHDMQAAASSTGIDEARLGLLERCVLSLTEGDEPRPVGVAPPGLIARMEDAMAAADPQADMHFDLTCPDCGKAWAADVDLGSFLGIEVDVGARRLLREVHELAAAYGWAEDQILGLPPARRQAYLDLVAAG